MSFLLRLSSNLQVPELHERSRCCFRALPTDFKWNKSLPLHRKKSQQRSCCHLTESPILNRLYLFVHLVVHQPSPPPPDVGATLLILLPLVVIHLRKLGPLWSSPSLEPAWDWLKILWYDALFYRFVCRSKGFKEEGDSAAPSASMKGCVKSWVQSSNHQTTLLWNLLLQEMAWTTRGGSWMRTAVPSSTGGWWRGIFGVFHIDSSQIRFRQCTLLDFFYPVVIYLSSRWAECCPCMPHNLSDLVFFFCI